MSTYTSKYPNGAAVDAALDDAGTALQPGDVVNALNSTATNAPLSAAQGKALNDAKLAASEVSNVANQAQQVLHGFPNRTASTIAFDNSGHVFTLGVSTTAVVYINGVPYTISSPGLTVDLDDKTLSVGLWYIWAEVSNGAAVLNASKSPWSITDTAAIPVATVYWNGAAGAICDERHGATRNLQTHLWQHVTVGARVANDGGFAQTYPTAAQSKIELIAGYLWDEDLATQCTTAQGKLVRNWYETAAGVWTFADGTNNGGNDRPYIWNGSTSRLRYPKSNSSYALTDVGSNNYIPVWVYASNDKDRPIYVVTGSATADYSIANARLVVPPTRPFAPEIKLLWRWIFKGDGVYQEAVDYRGSSTLPGGGVSAPAALSVSFAPTADVLSTNVQSAIVEVNNRVLTNHGSANLISSLMFGAL